VAVLRELWRAVINFGLVVRADNNGSSRHGIAEDPSARPEDAVLVVDDNDGGDVLYKYGPNQYGERDVIVPSRPPTASSEGRRLTPAE